MPIPYATAVADFKREPTLLAKLTVAGTITEREWTDKDGQKKVAQDVRVNEIALQGDGQAKAAPTATTKPAASSGFDDMADDIPFRDPLSYRAAHLVL